MEDKQFTTQFMAVLIILIGFTISILVIAKFLYSGDSGVDDERVQKEVAERIKPIGEVYKGSVPVAAQSADTQTAPQATSAAATELSGEQVYQQVCSTCHAAEVLNAPKPGDKAAWEARLAKGKETLYASALKGFNAMPAKGGRVDLSDSVVKEAVDYMLAQ